MEYNIYCDEAGTHGCRYLLIGGLWLPRDDEAILRQRLADVRQSYGLGAEMRWKKVSDLMLPAYQSFVDVVLLSPNVSFKCIVIEKGLIDYKTYHNGDKDLAFYKFYYYLVSRNINISDLYWLYTDERTSRQHEPLSTLKRTVNRSLYLRGASYDVLRSVEPRRSHDDDLIQVADVILGSIAAQWNGETTKAAKLTLMEHVTQRFGLHTLSAGTSRTMTRVNIWRWRPYLTKLMAQKKRPIS